MAHFRHKTGMQFLRKEYASNIGVDIEVDSPEFPLGISNWPVP